MRARGVSGPVPAGAAPEHEPLGREVGERPPRHPAEDVMTSESVKGISGAAHARWGRGHRGWSGPGRRLHGRPEHRLRMADEVGVQRIVARHQHHQGVVPRRPARPACPERGPRAGEARDHHRIEPGDVDPQPSAFVVATPRSAPLISAASSSRRSSGRNPAR